MVGEPPAAVGAVDGPAGRRLGRERGDERGDPTRGETSPPEIVDVDVVVAEQVGLDRRAVGG